MTGHDMTERSYRMLCAVSPRIHSSIQRTDYLSGSVLALRLFARAFFALSANFITGGGVPECFPFSVYRPMHSTVRNTTIDHDSLSIMFAWIAGSFFAMLMYAQISSCHGCHPLIGKDSLRQHAARPCPA